MLEQKEIDLTAIITEVNLKPDEARMFIENSLRDGALKTAGTDIDRFMPPVSRFGNSNRSAKKLSVIERLKRFFEKYFGVA